MATLYKTDGSTQTVSPKNKRDFKLKEVYQLLGISMVEVVHLADGRIMLIDEEGRFNADAETNAAASLLFQEGRRFSATHILNHFDEIVGNALVCQSGEFR